MSSGLPTACALFAIWSLTQQGCQSELTAGLSWTVCTASTWPYIRTRRYTAGNQLAKYADDMHELVGGSQSPPARPRLYLSSGC
jgi:hypothetical protein